MIQWNIDVDILQVVDAVSANVDMGRTAITLVVGHADSLAILPLVVLAIPAPLCVLVAGFLHNCRDPDADAQAHPG